MPGSNILIHMHCFLYCLCKP